jgi:hypothetical protein
MNEQSTKDSPNTAHENIQSQLDQIIWITFQHHLTEERRKDRRSEGRREEHRDRVRERGRESARDLRKLSKGEV